jgi:serine-type D-Ala-D-Ala carboxypeptidase/endopeptidase (penicillin-binding protein 4)
VAIAGVTLWPGAVFAQSLCPTELPAAIEAIAQSPALERAHWGLLVQPLQSETPLYAHNAEQFFIPASNAKLFVTAAALLRLGEGRRLRTSIYRVEDYWIEEPSDLGTVLQLVGRGDPSFGDAQLVTLAQQLRSQGITQINRLLLDQSTFSGSPTNPNWEWEDVQAGYGAPVTSLMLNQNAIALTLIPQALGQPLRVAWDDAAEAANWRIDNRSRTVAGSEPEFVDVGRWLHLAEGESRSQPVLTVSGQLRVGGEPEPVSVAVTDPDSAILRRMRQVFAQQGVMVQQTAVVQRPIPIGATEVAGVNSPPLAVLMNEANQESTNLYAEALLRILGTAPPVDASLTTLEQGLKTLEMTLMTLGVDFEQYELVDGSGLARQNLASPTALVQLLRGMARTPLSHTFRLSLAQAGVSGTLSDRFRDTPLERRIWGKTGAMTGVAALSGYVTPPNYEPLAVSLLVNHFDQPVRTVRPVMDEMVLTLGRLRPCP